MKESGNRGVRREYRCSFCDKSQDRVKRLIAGPRGVFICNECIDLCQEIIHEEEKTVAQFQEGQEQAQSGSWHTQETQN